MVLGAGSRVVVYSDGVVEQTSPEGLDFGVERTISTLGPSGDVETDVETLVRGVIDHAHPASMPSHGAPSRGIGRGLSRSILVRHGRRGSPVPVGSRSPLGSAMTP